MIILGIETSCDETSVALVDSNKNIICNEVFSQIKEHEPLGGVVPEIAARAHLSILPNIIKRALLKSKLLWDDISGIAATVGPGLYGSLLVGSTTAKTLSLTLDKPFIAVNHLEAHILTPRLTSNIEYPYLALLISGGHTQFIIVKGINKYITIGTTIDDALGEAFDKTARLLGFPYPGGKHLEELAKQCPITNIKFKPPLMYAKNCNFSFSGLKTAVSQEIAKLNKLGTIEKNKASIAKAFESTVLSLLKKKTSIAIEQFIKETGSFNSFVVSGGVAANNAIRSTLEKVTNSYNGIMYAPPIHLCGDNAAMVAWVGVEKLQNNITSEISTKTAPNFELS